MNETVQQLRRRIHHFLFFFREHVHWNGRRSRVNTAHHNGDEQNTNSPLGLSMSRIVSSAYLPHRHVRTQNPSRTRQRSKGNAKHALVVGDLRRQTCEVKVVLNELFVDFTEKIVAAQVAKPADPRRVFVGQVAADAHTYTHTHAHKSKCPGKVTPQHARQTHVKHVRPPGLFRAVVRSRVCEPPRRERTFRRVVHRRSGTNTPSRYMSAITTGKGQSTKKKEGKKKEKRNRKGRKGDAQVRQTKGAQTPPCTTTFHSHVTHTHTTAQPTPQTHTPQTRTCTTAVRGHLSVHCCGSAAVRRCGAMPSPTLQCRVVALPSPPQTDAVTLSTPLCRLKTHVQRRGTAQDRRAGRVRRALCTSLCPDSRPRQRQRQRQHTLHRPSHLHRHPHPAHTRQRPEHRRPSHPPVARRRGVGNGLQPPTPAPQRHNFAANRCTHYRHNTDTPQRTAAQPRTGARGRSKPPDSLWERSEARFWSIGKRLICFLC